MATLTVRGLARRFDEVVALRDVSLTVADGRVAALPGPSGCGKTTVLRLIAGLDSPDAGDVMIDGESVSVDRGLDLLSRWCRIPRSRFCITSTEMDSTNSISTPG